MSAFTRISSNDMDIESNPLSAPKPSYAVPASPLHGQFDLSSSLSSPARPTRSPGARRNNGLNYNGDWITSNNSSNNSNNHNHTFAQPATYSDRFIPSRQASDLDILADSMDAVNANGDCNGNRNSCSTYGLESNGMYNPSFSSHSSSIRDSGSESSRDSKHLMNTLLRNELLGAGTAGGDYSHPYHGMRGSYDGSDSGSGGGVDALLRSSTESRGSSLGGENCNGVGAGLGGASLDMRGSGNGNFTGHNVLKFRSDCRRSSGDAASISSNNSGGSGDSGVSANSLGSGGIGIPGSPASLGNIGGIGSSIRKNQRKINKTPYKVLDAPALQDDYYLNLLDWGSNNTLSVALGSTVYLWSASNSKVTKLCDTGTDNPVTSICWHPQGSHLAVGTNSGQVQLWDVQANALVREMSTHASRVGTMAWSSSLLASGSRDRTIMMHDARIHGGGSEPTTIGNNSSSNTSGSSAPSVVHECTSHRQEVCGLKWSPDEKMLASGGNDNKLYIWALNHADPSTPISRFNDHNAAVKAVAWSPHQSGLLASGGGTADRNIRFWNTLTGMPLHRIETGSQVCNLMWSKNVNEIVSTHGYSLNQVIVWKYPSMQKIATLTGHTLRVLYLAMSPDGQSVVTGAGDETLRFWNLFPGPRSASAGRGSGFLFPGGDIR